MTTYYVKTPANGGSNSNNGTSTGTAFATIQKALSVAGNNDTINVYSGTYNETGQLRITQNGLTLQAAAGQTPVVDGKWSKARVFNAAQRKVETPYQMADTAPINANNWTGWQLEYLAIEADDVSVIGMTFQNIAGGPFRIYGDDALIEDCIFDWCYAGANIKQHHATGKALTGVVIRNTRVSNVSFAKLDTTLYNNSNAWAKFASNGDGIIGNTAALAIQFSNGTIIEGCTFCYGFGEGVTFGRGGADGICRDTVIYDFDHVQAYMSRHPRATFERVLSFFTGDPFWLGPLSQPKPPACFSIGDETASASSSHSRTTRQRIINCIGINGQTGLDARNSNSTGSYDLTLDQAYIAYNTFVGGPMTDVVVRFKANLKGHPHQPGLFENNIVVKGSAPNISNGDMQGMTARNNAWSHSPPALGGAGDRIGSPNLVAETYIPSPKWPALWTDNEIETLINRYRPTAASSRIVNQAKPQTGITGFTPPLITVDYVGAQRETATPDIGAFEYGGTIVDPPPDDEEVFAAFNQSANGGVAPLTVNFTDQSTGTSTITSWFYEFRDGNTSTSASPSHTFTVPGTYRVKLTVTDENGLTDSYTGPQIVVQAAGGTNSTGVDAVRAAALTSNDVTQEITWSLGGQTPVAIMAIVSGATVVGTPADNAQLGLLFWAQAAGGVGGDSGALYSKHGVTQSVAKRRRGAGPLIVIDETGAIVGRAVVESVSANKATIRYTDGFPAGYQITWVAFAGSQTAAKSASLFMGAVNTQNSLTYGFTPNLHGAFSFFAGTDGNGDADVSLGWASSLADQYGALWHDRSGEADGFVQSWIGTTGTVLRSRPSTPKGKGDIRITNIGVGLHSVAIEDVNADIAVLGLRVDGGVDVKQFSSKTSAGSKSYAMAVSDVPSLLMLWGGLSQVPGASAFSDEQGSAFWAAVVKADGTTYCTSIASEDGAATMNTQSAADNQIKVYYGDGSLALAGTVTPTSTGFDINWTTTQSSEKFFNAMAVVGAETAANAIPAFTAAERTIAEGTTAQFQNLTNPNGVTVTGWLWDFGDGNGTSTAENPSYRYDTPGTYDVTLTVSSSAGDVSITEYSYIEVVGRTVIRRYVGMYRPTDISEDTENTMIDDPDAPNGLTHTHRHRPDVIWFDADITAPEARAGRVGLYIDPTTGNPAFIRPDGSTFVLSGSWS